MVCLKIELSKSAAGVSLRMFECYLILIFARLCSIIPHEGYLPYDRSGDWLYQSIESLSLCLAGTVVYLCRMRHAKTYDSRTDTFKHVLLILPTAVLAFLLHPSLNNYLPSDICWAFALYLESVACLPQLFMFQKRGKVEPFTSHFLASQALSKLLQFIFWCSSYSELNSDQDKPWKSYAGHWVVLLQGGQLLMMADFIYHYIRCITRGISVEYILDRV
eukprot:GHVO01011500.1.p1 GENE.GHVO01011500.1~~GHVO01011500.1.p1  ORF type:complete len:219 (+),score=17.95 GHVO01011500.1:80-736(+)